MPFQIIISLNPPEKIKEDPELLKNFFSKQVKKVSEMINKEEYEGNLTYNKKDIGNFLIYEGEIDVEDKNPDEVGFSLEMDEDLKKEFQGEQDKKDIDDLLNSI